MILLIFIEDCSIMEIYKTCIQGVIMIPDKKDSKNCQIFTPEKIVKFMLKNTEFCKNPIDTKILENSAGDGNFLVKIVDFVIPKLIDAGFKNKRIVLYLENNIHAFEVSEIHYKKCIRNLNKVAKKHNIKNVNWHVLQEDFLKYDFHCKYDLIIGNPPYIQYRNLDPDDRNYIKEKFTSCKKGKPDYYYAFIEKSIELLRKKGELVYLVPSNIFKNRFGDKIRDLMYDYVETIIDFQFLKLFDKGKRNTVSSIIKLVKRNDINTINYIDYTSKNKKVIYKNTLESKWSFEDFTFDVNTHRFGDYFNVNYATATLCNEAYVINHSELPEKVLNRHLNKHLRKAASPRNRFLNRQEYIVFPYTYMNGEFTVDKEFEKNEYLIKHLHAFDEKLKKRKSDKNNLWFQYGRSQALHTVNKHKLLISTVITDTVKVYELDNYTVAYSGIVITKKNVENEESLEFAKKVLEDNSFIEYVKIKGLKTGVNSIRITATDIKNYRY